MFQKLENKYSYKNSGVDIEKANSIIEEIFSNFKDDNFKNFAGLYSLKRQDFVSCTDGIGSKIIPLIDYNMPDIIANDLIAMNLNDLITKWAKPLFFLDYIATSSLDNNLDNIIKDTIFYLKKMLNNYDCKLLGGEISELNCLIKENYFDIAGFLVGILNKQEKKEIKKGDILIAFPSNGLHSNGFSLIRKLFSDKKIDKSTYKSFLKPTRIYYNEVYSLFEKGLIKAACNITGGGINDNLRRIIPHTLSYKIDYNSIKKQEVFEIIKTFVDVDECFNVFNMGVGFIVACDKNDVNKILEINPDCFILSELGENYGR